MQFRQLLARGLCCLPLLVVLAIGALRWPLLWTESPSHWDDAGVVNGWSAGWTSLIIPLVPTVIIAAVALLADFDDSGRAPYFWCFGIGAVCAAAAFVLSISVLSVPPAPDSAAWLLASPLFLLLGFVQFALIPPAPRKTEPTADALGARV